MIKRIISEILPSLEALNFADVVAGVVTTLSRNKPIKDNKVIIKKFPVYYNDTKTTCETSDYIDLVPNSSKKSIMYFEENGFSVTQINNNIFECVASVRLVCWFNLKNINDTLTNAELLKLNVIQAMPSAIDNVNPYSFIRVDLTSEETKSVAIFNKYTYNEEEKQYLIFPFDYFALNYDISFYVGKNCIDELIINPAVC